MRIRSPIACGVAAVIVSACVGSPDDLGSQRLAAAGPGDRVLWPNQRVPYAIHPSVDNPPDGGPSTTPFCTDVANAAPCLRSLRVRIDLAAGRYNDATALHFVRETWPPDLSSPDARIVYATSRAMGTSSSRTYHYSDLRKAYLRWRTRCQRTVDCNVAAPPYPCDPSRPTNHEINGWLFTGMHNTLLRPGLDADQDLLDEYDPDGAEYTLPSHDDFIVVLAERDTAQGWPTEENWMARHPHAPDPGWVHTTLHETGHALGMMHEQSRPDMTDNLFLFECNESHHAFCELDPPDTSPSDAFRTIDDALILSRYDFHSVMQYASKGEHPAIIAQYFVPGAADTPITQPDCDGHPRHGYLIMPDGGFSGEDFNILYQFYPRHLGANEPSDRFGAALAAGDFDGDGYLDLAIGAPGEQPGNGPASGSVYVFKGTYNGLVPWRRLDEPAGSRGDGDGFGSALAVGNVDSIAGDDLVVGAPHARASNGTIAGVAFVFPGGELGLRSESYQRLEPGIAFPEAPSANLDAFGSAIAVGAFHDSSSSDRRADPIAIGAPGRNFVYVFNTIGSTPHGIAAPPRTSADARFGATLVSGDLDGDALDDLVIGAPGAAATGLVYAARGAAPTALVRFDEPTAAATPNASGDGFGTSLAIASFGPGAAQIAIGAPGHTGNRGFVYVMSLQLHGGSYLPVYHRTLRRLDFSGQSDLADARFGAALASVDRFGLDDLAVGSPGGQNTAPSAGLVLYYRGTGTTAPTLTPLTALEEPVRSFSGPVESNDHFGAALASGNFDQRGGLDLAVATPGKHDTAGAAWVARTYLDAIPTFTAADPDDEQFWSRYLDQEHTYSHWVPATP